MFFTFYTDGQCKFDDLKNITQMIMNDISNEDIRIDEYGEHEFETDCKWFNLVIKDNSKGIKVVSEDYNMKLKFLFWFEIHYVEGNQSEKRMMRTIGKYISNLNCNCILFSNNDKPILKRANGTVLVDNWKINSSEQFPFEDMEMEYAEAHIVQV